VEKAGLIAKAPYGNHRLRMAYTATEKGKSTVPMLKEIVKWGLANIEGTGAAPPPQTEVAAES